MQLNPGHQITCYMYVVDELACKAYLNLALSPDNIVSVFRMTGIRGMFEMNCLFLSGDFKFQVSPKVLISCPRNTPHG